MLYNDEITQLIRNGGVGVLATDTVYGLVCSALLPDAVSRLYAIKHRDQKPGTLVAASVEQLLELGIPRRYLKPVESYWPNPISVVIPVGSAVHPEIHLGKGSIAVRIPNNLDLISLLVKVGPLLTTSANQPGEPPAVTIEQAQDYFGSDTDFYVDAGDLSERLPSTVIRIIDDAIEVVREGAVKISESGEILS